MSTILMIKKTMNFKDKDGVARAWVIYYDNKDKIKEVKSLFNLKQYKGSRPTYTDKQIISILEKETSS